MKRFFSALLLCMLTLFSMTGVACASEATHANLLPSSTIIKETDTYRLREIPDSVAQLPSEPISTVVDDGGVMPCYNTTGVTRLTPLGVLVYPVVLYNGEPAIFDDESVQFFSPALYFQNYIRDTLTRAKQNEIKDILEESGLEQLGWYMVTGYDIDTYKPGNFTYYEWTRAGKSGVHTKRAVDGSENIFEVVSYFKDGSLSSYKFGITGDVTYRTMPTSYDTVKMPIELSVTIE